MKKGVIVSCREPFNRLGSGAPSRPTFRCPICTDTSPRTLPPFSVSIRRSMSFFDAQPWGTAPDAPKVLVKGPRNPDHPPSSYSLYDAGPDRIIIFLSRGFIPFRTEAGRKLAASEKERAARQYGRVPIRQNSCLDQQHDATGRGHRIRDASCPGGQGG